MNSLRRLVDGWRVMTAKTARGRLGEFAKHQCATELSAELTKYERLVKAAERMEGSVSTAMRLNGNDAWVAARKEFLDALKEVKS